MPTSPASAAPVTYIEAIDGDLPMNSSLVPTLTLDAGLNTVSGTFTAGSTTPPADFDSFNVLVPAGLEVTGIKLLATEKTGNIVDVRWSLFNDRSNNGPLLERLNVPAPGFVFATTTPLGAGLYNVFNDQFRYPSNEGSPAGTLDYTFTFDVHQPVPEPAGLAALGMAAATLVRRRRGR